MRVTIDGEERKVRAGAPAQSLLNEAQREAAARGKVWVVDARGQHIGLEGALTDGGAYFTVTSGARPPSVNACLEAWETFGGVPSMPAPWAKFLVKRAIAALAEAGGGASAAGTAAFAAASRGDAEAMWAYLAGEGKDVTPWDAGSARVRAVLPEVKAVVLATRDILTFRTGATTFDYLEGINAIEVGSTNKVKLADYEREYGEVEAVVACRAADFGMEGFVAAPEAGELAAAASAAGLTFVNIVADGAVFDERGAPRRLAGDVVIWITPREARRYDLVVAPSVGRSPGAEALRPQAAAELWRAVKGG